MSRGFAHYALVLVLTISLLPSCQKKLRPINDGSVAFELQRYGEAILSLFAEESGKDIGLPNMTPEMRTRADEAVNQMVEVQGYPRPSIPEVLAALLKARY